MICISVGILVGFCQLIFNMQPKWVARPAQKKGAAVHSLKRAKHTTPNAAGGCSDPNVTLGHSQTSDSTAYSTQARFHGGGSAPLELLSHKQGQLQG